MPVEQLVQAVADSEEYVPAAQMPVTVVRPVVAQKLPEGHAVIELCPVDAQKDPASQLLHEPEPDMA